MTSILSKFELIKVFRGHSQNIIHNNKITLEVVCITKVLAKSSVRYWNKKKVCETKFNKIQFILGSLGVSMWISGYM